MKCLLLLSLVAFAAAAGPNVQFRASFGGTAYVDPEELLEKALYHALSSQGILKVDVDDRRYTNNAFEVELYSKDDLGGDLKATLEKTLRSDLGFAGVSVKPHPPNTWFNRHFGASKASFEVYFDPATMQQTMEALATSLHSSTYFSLEDSLFD